MNGELAVDVLQRLSREKDLPMRTVLDALVSGIKVAFEKQFLGGKSPSGKKSSPRIRVILEPEAKSFKITIEKTVVERVTNKHLEIPLSVAARFNPNVQVSDKVEVELSLAEFSRGATQIVKQEMMRKINEAELRKVYEEYKGREGEILVGEVRRVDRKGNVYISVGKTEVLLMPKEQVKGEAYKVEERFRVYITEVSKPESGLRPLVKVSRSHPELVRKLFEVEVPEIKEGVVEIKTIARDPGVRSKVSVASKDPNVDPVGACIGQQGKRVNAVVEELRNEKVDVVRYSDDPVEHLSEALKPAKVDIIVLDEDKQKTATVIVAEDQLSLAIGKQGRNVSLAARLSGWRIDVRSYQQMAEMVKEPAGIVGVTPKLPASGDSKTPASKTATSPTPKPAALSGEDDGHLPEAEVQAPAVEKSNEPTGQ